MTWSEDTEKTEVSSAWNCTKIGRKATEASWSMGNSHQILRFFFLLLHWSNSGRGCSKRISILPGIQDWARHGHEQLDLIRPIWVGGWTRQLPEVPSNLSYSMICCFSLPKIIKVQFVIKAQRTYLLLCYSFVKCTNSLKPLKMKVFLRSQEVKLLNIF